MRSVISGTQMQAEWSMSSLTFSLYHIIPILLMYSMSPCLVELLREAQSSHE